MILEYFELFKKIRSSLSIFLSNQISSSKNIQTEYVNFNNLLEDLTRSGKSKGFGILSSDNKKGNLKDNHNKSHNTYEKEHLHKIRENIFFPISSFDFFPRNPNDLADYFLLLFIFLKTAPGSKNQNKLNSFAIKDFFKNNDSITTNKNKEEEIHFINKHAITSFIKNYIVSKYQNLYIFNLENGFFKIIELIPFTRTILSELEVYFNNLPLYRWFYGLDQSNGDELKSISSSLNEKCEEFDYKLSILEIGEYFEKIQYMIQTKQQQQGHFYTQESEINFLWHFLVDDGFWSFKKHFGNSFWDEKQNISILDLACGQGALLVHNDSLLNLFNQIYEKSIVTNKISKIDIVGIDVNAIALFIANLRSTLWTSFHSSNINKKIENNILQINKYFSFTWIQADSIGNFEKKSKFQMQSTLFDYYKSNNYKDKCPSEQIYIQKILKKYNIIPFFDIIIGNPPYQRYRDISPPLVLNFVNGSSMVKTGEYRKNLEIIQKKFYDVLIKSDNILSRKQFLTLQYFKKRLDYSLYFFLLSAILLRPNGRLGLILSNSWLNVEYGIGLKKYLLDSAALYHIIDNDKRSFQNAQINTIMLFYEKPNNYQHFQKSSSTSPDLNLIQKNVLNFIRWKIPFSNIDKHSRNELLKKLKNKDSGKIKAYYNNVKDKKAKSNIFPAYISSFYENAAFRIISINKNLVSINLPNRNKYSRNRLIKEREYSPEEYDLLNKPWGNYFFYAPPIIFHLLEYYNLDFKLKSKEKNISRLIKIKDIFNVRRGITTNCNDFFILKIVKKLDSIQQDKSLLLENGYGDQVYLEKDLVQPILFTPREIGFPILNSKDLNKRIFYVDLSKKELMKKGFVNSLNYISLGEKKKIKIKKGAGRSKIIDGVVSLSSFKDKFKKDENTWYCLKKTIDIETKNKKIRENNKEKEKIVNKDPNKGNIFIQKIFNNTFKVVFSSKPMIVNNTFYLLTPKSLFLQNDECLMDKLRTLRIEFIKSKVDVNLFFSFLMLYTPLTILLLDLFGRTNFGGGALDTSKDDIENLLIPNPFYFSDEEKINLIIKGCNLIKIPFQESKRMFKNKERREFDELLFKYLDLPISADEIYKHILSLQERRLTKKKF